MKRLCLFGMDLANVPHSIEYGDTEEELTKFRREWYRDFAPDEVHTVIVPVGSEAFGFLLALDKDAYDWERELVAA